MKYEVTISQNIHTHIHAHIHGYIYNSLHSYIYTADLSFTARKNYNKLHTFINLKNDLRLLKNITYHTISIT